jgi:hypothetical protein
MVRCCFSVLVALLATSIATAQDLNTVREDQLNRLKNYVLAAIQPNGLVRDSIVLNNPGGSFHPATPDAAGFALVSLSALNHLGKLPDAEQRVISVLSAYTGQTPGVVPQRSADGHFVHSMNVNNGAYLPPWDDSYTPIGTALLVAGAQFARNHFPGNTTIASLTNQLTNSVNFNNAIHPSLNGGIFLDMGAGGGGTDDIVGSWNEFMLVESLALREANNARALAVKHKWLDTDFLPKRSYSGIPTLTDNPGVYAPAFWVQQMQFFNGDFRHSADFQTFFTNQKQADKLYSFGALAQTYRYGLTAGLIPYDPDNPNDPNDPFDTYFGYHADRMGVGGTFDDHPYNVFSPEAVAAWGDMDTLLQFHEAQNPGPNPSSNLSYQFGMVRVSTAPPPDQPNWIPPDAGLVDHLFLLFGLVESLHPNFFADRVFPALATGDYNANGAVDAVDYGEWRKTFGSQTQLWADGNHNSVVDASDYVIWRNGANSPGASAAAGVPEPQSATLAVLIFGWVVFFGAQRRAGERRRSGTLSL